jgi:cyclopropane-fatty-acyl-phospholipid synthase
MASQLKHKSDFREAPRQPQKAVILPIRTPLRESAPKEFIELLQEIEKGYLVIAAPGQAEFHFGKPDSALKARWSAHNPAAYWAILQKGSLGLGESYVDGWWSVEDNRIADLIGILLQNKISERVKTNILLLIRLAFFRLIHSPKSRFLARRSVRQHYDLSQAFFQYMLDPSLTYSCGYQKGEADTLSQMQEQKYDLIARKLDLRRGGTVLDIGCGWGGFLLHAAARYKNIHGIGITLSKDQYRFASRRVAELGLANRINIKLCDYRDLSGKFDYLVSIGMFEHVGKSSYGTFMRKAAELLKEDGAGLLHTISTTEAPWVRPDPWLNRYIFPGTRLPRLEEIARAMRKADLLIAHVEDLKLNYAATLREWKKNVDSNIENIKALSPEFNDRFLRMWDYYLQACEACFRYGPTEVYQVLFSKSERWAFQQTFDKFG